MKNKALNFPPGSVRYRGIIGTGGIGSGKFFVLNGDHTLGREESRSGHFLNTRDYCKQHIILHYIKVLLGPSFSVMPIGRIGNDDTGRILHEEMVQTGFCMDRIEMVPDVPTLFSLCFSYPDGSGGNLTTDDSASARVDEAFIEKAASDIEKLGSHGIIMAAPEVPLKARQKLLELGRQYGLYCSASFTTGEINHAIESGIIGKLDLIAINLDEASAIAGLHTDPPDALAIIQSTVEKLSLANDRIMISITAGKRGSWCRDTSQLYWFPSVETRAVSTAGAGDAFFSGLLCGIALGLTTPESQQLATLVAGLSVTSPHTIHDGIERRSLGEFQRKSGLSFSEKINKLLED